MARRRFSDDNGVEWDVYEVVALPSFGRPGEPQVAPHSEVFRAARLSLVFESADEKRRLPAIPENWERAPIDELRRMLVKAVKVNKSES